LARISNIYICIYGFNWAWQCFLAWPLMTLETTGATGLLGLRVNGYHASVLLFCYLFSRFFPWGFCLSIPVAAA
jgi:hypothetical protein